MPEQNPVEGEIFSPDIHESPDDLTDRDLTTEEYAWARTGTLTLIGAGLVVAGYTRSELPEWANAEVLGTAPIESARHVFPAVVATAFSEFCDDGLPRIALKPVRYLGGQRLHDKLFSLSMRHEKLASFVIGFVPSLSYEIYQYARGGRFGIADLITAAGAGAITLCLSTKRVPFGRQKPLIRVISTSSQ